MTMKVTRIITKEISRCYHECPYFNLEGGPGPVMVCGHPEAKSPYIVSHPECDTGFPKECPLLMEDRKDI